mmetsp:Transcript_76735/g.211990  ORF Transcript_76735/g.211990 Transcript_76735/m.211990 type:complete len:448 (-) Transcript_76735:83-1426(-)
MLRVVLFAASLVTVVTSAAAEWPGCTAQLSHSCSNLERSAVAGSSLVQGVIRKSKLKNSPKELGISTPDASAPLAKGRASKSSITIGATGPEVGTQPGVQVGNTVEVAHEESNHSLPLAEHRDLLHPVAALLQHAREFDLKQRLHVAFRSVHLVGTYAESLPRVIVVGLLWFVGVVVCMAGCYMGWRQPQTRPALRQTSGERQKTRPPPGRSDGAATLRAPSLRTFSPQSCAPPSSPSIPGLPTLASAIARPTSVESPQLPGRGAHLCPELVIPHGSVCNLLVPLEPPSIANGNSIAITDMNAVPLFKATFTLSATAHGQSGKPGVDCIVLCSTTSDEVFASCCAADGGDRPGFKICNNSGTFFATIRADGPAPCNGYSVARLDGSPIRFQRDPKSCKLKGVDESGCLIAVSETRGTLRNVRIAQLVDAGLVLLSVLGIDAMVQVSS